MPPTILNNAALAPPLIEKVAGLVPTVSTSVEISAATTVVFSATVWVAFVVMTGAWVLPFGAFGWPGVGRPGGGVGASLTSVTLTVIVCAVVWMPSEAETWT